MTDAERIAAAVERIKLATAGATVNERAARRLGRRLSRWLRRCGVRYICWGGNRCFWWWADFWGFYDNFHRGSGRPNAQELRAIADSVVESVERQAEEAASWGDDVYRTRQALEDTLRKLGAK